MKAGASEALGAFASRTPSGVRGLKFIPPSESAVTFNGQVTFTTPSISGTAWPDYIAGKWRERKDFNALADAEAALNLIDSNGGLTE